MPTKGEGAIGALDFSPVERRKLAKKVRLFSRFACYCENHVTHVVIWGWPSSIQSVDFCCDTCGKILDLLPELKSDASDGADTSDQRANKYAEQIAQLHMHSLEPTTAARDAANSPSGSEEDAQAKASEPDATSPERSTTRGTETPERRPVPEEATVAAAAPAAESERSPPPQEQQQQEQHAATPTAAPTTGVAPSGASPRAADSVDSVLHYLSVALFVALLALVYKKLLHLQGVLPN